MTAALAALERGEVTCVPGREGLQLLDRRAEARRTTMAADNRPRLAARYRNT